MSALSPTLLCTLLLVARTRGGNQRYGDLRFLGFVNLFRIALRAFHCFQGTVLKLLVQNNTNDVGPWFVSSPCPKTKISCSLPGTTGNKQTREDFLARKLWVTQHNCLDTGNEDRMAAYVCIYSGQHATGLCFRVNLEVF